MFPLEVQAVPAVIMKGRERAVGQDETHRSFNSILIQELFSLSRLLTERKFAHQKVKVSTQ